MSGFGGFQEVRQEHQRGWRDSLVNLALRVESVASSGQRDYVVGLDMATGRRVRAVLADRRTFEGRAGLRQRAAEAGPDGTLVLVDCMHNRVGTYEAFNAVPFPPGSAVLVDGVARVMPPTAREDGSWRQSVQHLRTEGASRCRSYADVVSAVLAALAEPGPGRSGAVVRGWHPARGGMIGFEIGSTFDPEAREYLPADASFDAFLAMPDVFVGGLGTSASGEHCMSAVARLMDTAPGSIAWEVIPKRTYSLGGIVAEAAGLRTGKDPSRPYRTDPDRAGRATGCLPSVLGFVQRHGVLWPRVALPHRGGDPVPELRVETASIRPPVRPSPVRAPWVSARTASVARGATAASGRPGPFGQAARHVPVGDEDLDPVQDPDIPAPLPPDLLPRVAAAGPGSPDIGGRGAGTEDVAALSRQPGAHPGIANAPGR